MKKAKYYLVCDGFVGGEHALDVLHQSTEYKLFRNKAKANSYISKMVQEYKSIYGNSVYCPLRLVDVYEDGFLDLPPEKIKNYRCSCGRKKKYFAVFCPKCNTAPASIPYFIPHECCSWDPKDWLN